MVTSVVKFAYRVSSELGLGVDYIKFNMADRAVVRHVHSSTADKSNAPSARRSETH